MEENPAFMSLSNHNLFNSRLDTGFQKIIRVLIINCSR